jgi:ubiquinol-cytochrome c reductase cytochrome c subunit
VQLRARGRHPGHPPRRRSGLPALLLLLGLIGVGYAVSAPRGHAQAPAQTATAVQEGRNLFLTSCASCHGLNAQGGNQAPPLIGKGGAAVDFQVSTGRMPLQQQGPQAARKPARFSQEDIDRLAAYIQSLGGGPAVPSERDLDLADAKVSEGSGIFRANCASCHSFAGQGGALTRGKYAPNLTRATDRQIYEAMLTGPESMPRFGNGQITPDEKRSVIKFIRALDTESNPGGHGLGRLGPIPEGLVAFLIGLGVLVVMTLWIGARA